MSSSMAPALIIRSAVPAELRRSHLIFRQTRTLSPTECKSEKCGICLERFPTEYDDWTEDKPVQVARCGHIWHHSCLLAWTEESSTCPLCRQEMFPVNAFPRYIAPYDEADLANSEGTYNRLVRALSPKNRQLVEAYKPIWCHEVWNRGRGHMEIEGDYVYIEDEQYAPGSNHYTVSDGGEEDDEEEEEDDQEEGWELNPNWMSPPGSPSSSSADSFFVR